MRLEFLEILNSKLFQHIVKIAISQPRVRRLINFLAKEKKRKEIEKEVNIRDIHFFAIIYLPLKDPSLLLIEEAIPNI